ncbi:MAG: FtsW/RodA/SpoVE family cell cycle protein [Lachnospiraceae bacterium]|nr:FtsW/RodA/SpoVE family cell cycle protein [Lachnospiraceae bacterium]
MDIDEYLCAVTDQIRDKYAKVFVSDEIRTHIEEQASAYINDGMNRDEAYSKAVVDMGDPVEVGAELDRIHRPHMEWKFLVIILLISLVSIAVNNLINGIMDGRFIFLGPVMVHISGSHFAGLVLGLIAMFAMYRADYTVMIGRSRAIGGIFLGILTLLFALFGIDMNGDNWRMSVGSFVFSARPLYILYLPVFAGILYEYRCKNKMLISIGFWMIAPLISMCLCSYFSIPVAVFMIISEIVLLMLAIYKRWYGFDKKNVFYGIGIVLLFASVMMIFISTKVENYQIARIKTWLCNMGIVNHATDNSGGNYINAKLMEVFRKSDLIGQNYDAVHIMTNLPGYKDDLIIGTISAYCGILAVAGIMISLFLLAVYIFYISAKQKNQLGYIVGCACGIIIFFQSLSNLLIVLGLLPLTESSLPFISKGTGTMIVDYVLIGLVLSIYRYKDLRNDKIVAKKARKDIFSLEI